LRLVAATVLAILLAYVPAHAQVLVYEVFGAYLNSLRDQAGIPGLAAAIVDNDGIVWERAYGMQDIGRSIATRVDTPFHADGLTQIFTAAMVLRCVEEGKLSLDDRVGAFNVSTFEPDATIRELLTHTSGPSDNLRYAQDDERMAPLWPIIRVCRDDSYRETLANLLTRLAMFDSVPGPNIVSLVRPSEGMPTPADRDRYASVLARRAMPYAVYDRDRARQSSYPDASSILTPSSGLVTTVRDLAKFDLALKQGILVDSRTLADAWSPPVGADGTPLPHGVGWFVQDHNGEKVVWQYGLSENAASSLVVMLPSRGLTLILLANSDGLTRLYSPAKGDITLSTFGSLFLNLFVR
jgi:CubicO group peptidase (beta-lactamase class C family)